MAPNIPDGSFTPTEDLLVYAVKAGGIQQGYQGAGTRPWLQRLTVATAGYTLSALVISVVSPGRRKPYLEAIFSKAPKFEVTLAILAVCIYLAPLIFAYTSLSVLPKLIRNVAKPVAGERPFALPKVPMRASWKPVVRTLWWIIVATLLGLAVAPALAIRACVVLGAVEGVLLLIVLAFEQWRGVQVIVFFARNGLRSRHQFHALYVRGQIWPMIDALGRVDSQLISLIAVRFIYARRYDDAMALLKARFAHVHEAHVAVNIACCLTRLQRIDEALTWLRAAHAIVPLTKHVTRLSSLRPLRKAGLLTEFDAR